MNIEFKPGVRYRAHIAVEAPITAPSTDRVKKALLDKTNGKLSDLQVYSTPPQDWSADEQQDKADIGMAGYWLEGTWNGTEPGSIPQSTDVYQVLWVKVLGNNKEEYESSGSKYAWIPILGTVGLLGTALYVAVKGASR
jgi:hypothetical protein